MGRFINTVELKPDQVAAQRIAREERQARASLPAAQQAFQEARNGTAAQKTAALYDLVEVQGQLLAALIDRER